MNIVPQPPKTPYVECHLCGGTEAHARKVSSPNTVEHLVIYCETCANEKHEQAEQIAELQEALDDQRSSFAEQEIAYKMLLNE